ncbi:hypothetical protein GCM10027155_11730 [Acinetobacter apis]|uniref:Uncharacterized protein n=1 Tax=Acinetobacter apis TaxID=1229165 RepID=A0A217EFZ6_9GAMM|nr:hypothetical protein [Acinetobacter apis]SNQ29252.1 hypothetical protein SAMN05444584_1199 [Acinetobacter apis]
MNLQFTHKPNYFLGAQLVVRHLQNTLQKEKRDHVIFSIDDFKQLFQGDNASATIDLDSILHIAKQYKVETLSGDTALIQSYHIDGEKHNVNFTINTSAVDALNEGKSFITPDASSYE